MFETDIVIIGAGVVGLAIAAELAHDNRSIFVLERNDTFGQETSSHNSQVIHSGIYYPANSLKTKTCVTGNKMLYQLCHRHGIAHKKSGKLIVAIDEEERKQLEELKERGEKNGIEGLEMLDRPAIKQMEPNIRAVAAIFLPSTGLIDVHALMSYYQRKARDNSAQITYRTRVAGIEKIGGEGYKLIVEDPGGNFSFMTRIVINCAGLNSDKIAEMAGIDIVKAEYKLHYCKGEYFKLAKNKSKLINKLVYPVPESKIAGLGIHATPGLDGTVLLGPNTRYIDSLDYSVDGQQQEAFYNSVVKFLPFIQYDDLEPEMAGIRPKLQGPRDNFRDFVIRDEYDRGLPGFINLIGIESPGLTGAPAIAQYVSELVDKALRN